MTEKSKFKQVDKYFELPWKERLPKRNNIEHPQSVNSFENWPISKNDDNAHKYLDYLKLCDEQVKRKWDDAWTNVLAVGPFLNRKNFYPVVPFVLVANYRRPYKHLLRLSEVLAYAYIEFGIFPDVHLVLSKLADGLDEIEHQDWYKTKLISINWSEDY